jgi:hypothetical protein
VRGIFYPVPHAIATIATSGMSAPLETEKPAKRHICRLAGDGLVDLLSEELKVTPADSMGM